MKVREKIACEQAHLIGKGGGAAIARGPSAFAEYFKNHKLDDVCSKMAAYVYMKTLTNKIYQSP